MGESTEAILLLFDENVKNGIQIIESATDEHLNAVWTLRRGEKIVSTLPRKVALRNMVFNHTVHHRGQLSVFLRLLNIPVPGVYGPSADEI